MIEFSIFKILAPEVEILWNRGAPLHIKGFQTISRAPGGTVGWEISMWQTKTNNRPSLINSFVPSQAMLVQAQQVSRILEHQACLDSKEHVLRFISNYVKFLFNKCCWHLRIGKKELAFTCEGSHILLPMMWLWLVPWMP